tara:strand:+ start:1056 stop:1208 length:153 start_codon:yes stop_codon:yes gene_type:complete
MGSNKKEMKETLKIKLLLQTQKLGIYLANLSWEKGLNEKSWQRGKKRRSE